MLAKPLTKDNYLSQIPLKKELDYTEADGKITLMLPRFKNEKFIQWFIPKRKPSHVKFHLDETGSEVWRSIDGTKPVEFICQEVKNHLENMGKPVNQIEERVTSFLTILSRNGFICFNEVQPQSGE